jgi:hypothetical protein
MESLPIGRGKIKVGVLVQTIGVHEGHLILGTVREFIQEGLSP